MDSAQGDMAQVDKVRLMLQRHQEQLQTIHELREIRDKSATALLRELIHKFISIIPIYLLVIHILSPGRALSFSEATSQGMQKFSLGQ